MNARFSEEVAFAADFGRHGAVITELTSHRLLQKQYDEKEDFTIS